MGLISRVSSRTYSFSEMARPTAFHMTVEIADQWNTNHRELMQYCSLVCAEALQIYPEQCNITQLKTIFDSYGPIVDTKSLLRYQPIHVHHTDRLKATRVLYYKNQNKTCLLFM